MRNQAVRNAPRQAITTGEARPIADPWYRCQVLASCAERLCSEERLPPIRAAPEA